jgi:hypothetical protein
MFGHETRKLSLQRLLVRRSRGREVRCSVLAYRQGLAVGENAKESKLLIEAIVWHAGKEGPARLLVRQLLRVSCWGVSC